MKRIFSVILGSFWLVFMLFFAIPFPMIIYYAAQSDMEVTPLLDKNPVTALIILAISVIMWGLLLAGYFYRYIIFVFVARRNMEKLKADGVRRQAEILSSEKISTTAGKLDTWDMKLSFKNLADTTITENMQVNDARPYERRFEKGKKVDILIDKNMKRVPYMMFATTEASVKIGIVALRILGWLSIVATVAAYYIYAYSTENEGAGWRFLSFGHPLIVCPAILFFYRFLSWLIITYAEKTSEKIFIKFKGTRATARLIKASQTGTYINEQPQIKFELEYNDEQGRLQKISTNKVIDLLNLDITKQSHLDIFYLREDPSRIAFAHDLDDLDN
jgi:hypothetical protein